MSEQQPAGRWSRWAGPLVMLVAAGSFGSVVVGMLLPSAAERELAALRPTEQLRDPSTAIPGVIVEPVPTHEHDVPGAEPVLEPGRPPTGGSHGPRAAPCDGVTSPGPVDPAEAVHALEHGAVWVTYNPGLLRADTVRQLGFRVTDGDDLLLSPFPGLGAPLSLQSWGHRLVLDTPADPRFEQFLVALAGNPFLVPEPDAGCPPA
ncbi:hypothetical protein GCM10017691_19540 [Pseudonocardia petroleophila]|uniref:DUF3105 domain-containing protein n=1 Tax=Pseudonocardia petroleophila TaxID=37331 RepID=A0A7G7MGX2_9PSEU|nr:DUF3105 domain-containing protein [Pseudonocardia petroleophila]QNG52033.1 DUF3105 domain-containing protein [Pseudonocardia petroleophila]